jgi:putative transposase
MESFQLAQVTERTAKMVHRARAQARSDVFDHIECFYNPVRRHPTLGYLCPILNRPGFQRPLTCPL